MTVLVTGGSGYLGTALVPLLKGDDVHILDLNPPALDFPDVRYRFFKGSVTERYSVKEAIRGVETVIHLAGIAGVNVCERDPDLSEKVNVKGTETLLQEAKGVENFIFVSSSAVYGQMEGYIDEEKEPSPINIYGKHKLQAEVIVRASGIDYIILRPSNLYGASPLIPEKYAIHRMVKDALQRGTITVSYGNLMRNFIHVRDCAKCISVIMESDIRDRIFNVGDFDLKLFEIADKIAREIEMLNGKNINIDVRSWEEKGVLKYSWEKLRSAGFSPEISMKQGIREVIGKMSEISGLDKRPSFI